MLIPFSTLFMLSVGSGGFFVGEEEEEAEEEERAVAASSMFGEEVGRSWKNKLSEKVARKSFYSSNFYGQYVMSWLRVLAHFDAKT